MTTNLMELRKDPNLFSKIKAEIVGRGYAGDLTPPLLAYVAAMSRLLDNPLNLVLVGPSGAGKNRAIDAD